MEFARLDSKSSKNAVHITKFVPVLPAHGSEAHKLTLRELHFGHQGRGDTKALEKEHKNLNSGPFPAYLILGRRLYTPCL
jgi:hypothetical protein